MVIDAWRREAFTERDLGLANASLAIGAYRVAIMLASGGGAPDPGRVRGLEGHHLAMAVWIIRWRCGHLPVWSTGGRLDPAALAPLGAAVLNP